MAIVPTPTQSKTTISTPTSIATISETPVLPASDARVRLIDLLANNSGCQLPCLWGITPGTTTSQEASQILSPMSSLSDFYAFKPDRGAIYISDGLQDGQILNMNISFFADLDHIYHVHFKAEALRKLTEENGFAEVFDSTDFGDRLGFYMLDQVLNNYGRPDSVLLTTFGEFPPQRYGQGHFKLILLYPEQGIVVQYTTEMQVVGANVEGCLANAHVEMELFPPGDVDAFYEQLAPTDWPNRIAYYRPIEEVTSLSIDDFYETFRQSTDKCLVTSARLWPTPER